MRPKISAEFCITGVQITPEEITNRIGILPSRTWKVGESIQNTSLHRRHNGWCLSTTVDNQELDLANPAKSILQVLVPKSAIIKKTCSDFNLNCWLSYAIHIVDETPIISLGPEILSGLVELNATIDIDIILRRKIKN